MKRAVADLLSGFSSTLKEAVVTSINQEFENCQIFHPLPDGVILFEQTVFCLTRLAAVRYINGMNIHSYRKRHHCE